MIVGNRAISSMDCRIKLSREISSGLGSKVYISSTQRARMFIILLPSRSTMCTMVRWSSDMLSFISSRKADNSSLSGNLPDNSR